MNAVFPNAMDCLHFGKHSSNHNNPCNNRTISYEETIKKEDIL